ncbi:MAG: DNA circularization N-terminal domain-containing protein [Actinomycetota bacterium]|nr:DNA circularization N-terminal domain-containing protein [Actinomycetota bacterium]
MRPMVDDLELPNVQEIETRDRRDLVQHKVPGMDGSRVQNLGRAATFVEVHGVAAGRDALALVERLEEKLRTRRPAPFVADIVEASRVDTFVVDDVRVEEVGGKPARYAYTIVLREHVEPVVPEPDLGIDLGLLEDAQELIGDVVDGLTLGAELVEAVTSFAAQLGDFYERVQALREAAG